MNVLEFLWEIILINIQLLGIIWPALLFAAAMVLIKLGIRLYKNRRYAQAGISEIDQLDGEAFEEYLAILFKKLGYQVKRTPYQGDYGADLILKRGDEKTVVQAKRYKRNVGVKAVQEAVTSKEYYRCDKAMVVTNSYFSQQAKTLARANQVDLWDRDALVECLLSVKGAASVEYASSMEDVVDKEIKLSPTAYAQTAPTCATCGKPVSAKVYEYCATHVDIFQGFTYCYQHQKEMRRIQTTRI